MKNKLSILIALLTVGAGGLLATAGDNLNSDVKPLVLQLKKEAAAQKIADEVRQHVCTAAPTALSITLYCQSANSAKPSYVSASESCYDACERSYNYCLGVCDDHDYKGNINVCHGSCYHGLASCKEGCWNN